MHGNGVDMLPRAENVPSGDMRFEEFSAHWFETFVRTNNKPSEQHAKRQILERHLVPWFGPCTLSTLRGDLIERYKGAKLADGLHPKTINNQLAVLSKCLGSAVQWGHIAARPCILKLKVPPPPFDYLQPEEIVELLSDRVEPGWTDMVAIAVNTGLRLGELLALEWTNVDLTRRLLVVRQSLWKNQIVTTKNHRIRIVPLVEDAFKILASRHQDGAFVFGRLDGRPAAVETAGDVLKRKCRRVGLRTVGWHVLRHTFASLLATEGVPLHTIQVLLGHSSPSMTMRYAHLAPKAFGNAMELLERTLTFHRIQNSGQQVGTKHDVPVLPIRA